MTMRWFGYGKMERPFTEEELKQILQGLDDTSAAWQAVRQVLNEAINNSTDCALVDGIPPDDRQWRSGYAQAMRDVLATLNNYRKQPSLKA
jgi:hypothetical protein